MLDLTKDWSRFAPKRRAKIGKLPEINVATLAMFQEQPRVKFRVIERHYFFSGITTRINSFKVCDFQEYLPAIGYVRARMDQFETTHGEELKKLRQGNEAVKLCFTIEYIYEK